MTLFKNNFYQGHLEVDKTAYAEAFDGRFLRFIITADDEDTVRYAAQGTTALPSTVVGRSEGGIEKYIGEKFTPDGRPGAIVQLWMNAGTTPEIFDYEMSLRLRQGTLVELETAIYDANRWAIEKYDTMKSVGCCGDGFEQTFKMLDRKIISVPIMSGEFLIEKELGIGNGITGGNVWFFCEDKECLPMLREKVLDDLQKIPGVTAPFRICSAGSKVGSLMAEKLEGTPEGEAYRAIGPTTNHQWCPSLRGMMPDNKVPEGIERIPEVVIDGVTLSAVEFAMASVIYSVQGIDGVVGVSAGDYGGKLGKHKLYLKDLFNI